MTREQLAYARASRRLVTVEAVALLLAAVVGWLSLRH